MAGYLVLILLVVLAIGAPIAVSLGLTAVGYFLIKDQANLLFIIAQRLWAGCNSFELIAIPLFVLSGDLMLEGAISKALVNLSNSVLGWLKGSLGMVTTLACMFFGAVSGSGPATASAIGSIVAKSMEEEGYPKPYTSAVIASSGPLGTLIPPSILMVVYGAATGTSISKLLLGGIGPGLLFGFMFMIYEAYVGHKYKYGHVTPFSFKRFLVSLKDGIWALLAPLVILGGIYSGIFTPTEAAAVAVVYSLVIGMFVNKTIKVKDMGRILYRSGVTTGTIMLVVGAVSTFGYVITRENIPQQLTVAATGAIKSPMVFLFMVQFILLIAGMLMNGSAAILLLAPLLAPTVRYFGIDHVFFGALMVANLAIGMYTPPVAVTSYVASRITKTSFDQTNKGLVPFLAISIFGLVILILIPGIITWIPYALLK